MEPFGEMLSARNVNEPLLFLSLKEYFPLKTINFAFSEGISNDNLKQIVLSKT